MERMQAPNMEWSQKKQGSPKKTNKNKKSSSKLLSIPKLNLEDNQDCAKEVEP